MAQIYKIQSHRPATQICPMKAKDSTCTFLFRKKEDFIELTLLTVGIVFCRDDSCRIYRQPKVFLFMKISFMTKVCPPLSFTFLGQIYFIDAGHCKLLFFILKTCSVCFILLCARSVKVHHFKLLSKRVSPFLTCYAHCGHFLGLVYTIFVSILDILDN